MIYSKLGVDKVHKTTVVSMELKQEHIEASLVHAHGNWDFEAPTSDMPMSSNATYEAVSSEFNPGESEEVLDFDQLAQQLIEEAAANPDSDDPDDDEPSSPAPPLTI
jgi:hypothetical protein